ncbi:helix-turn-helix domain-containing protein [Planktotalea sp.]|uniref:helix-turn-helix domain-containing protein n=1 Tax=Planktotalea sp. TaxID=2029877 RepID=UPI003299AA91
MKSHYNSDAWLPDHKWGAIAEHVIDLEFSDFDAQAERLTGHDQEYLQLTDGQFWGRFLSCFLGDVSLHFEQANQALSQSIAASSDTYSIGVVLSGDLFRVDGIDVDRSSFFIVPPHTSFHLYSPKDGAILACVIDRQVMEQAVQHMPNVQDWFLGQGRHIRCLRAPKIADRLRHDAMSALHASCMSSDQNALPKSLGHAVLHSFLACLFLEFSAQASPDFAGHSKGFKHFASIKSLLETDPPTDASLDKISQDLGVSKRSLQYAFSSEVSLGVTGYLRHTRLRSVRRRLLDPHSRDTSIGDIAAQYGYWSWSHFSQQYSKHFGERPSDTRERLS